MLKKGWFGGGLWKPKNLHSVEHLRYLHSLLSKHQVVQESNHSIIIESLRSIAEILIWGDQNDSSVFDFFLEKNMLSFFLRIMKQKCGSYVCVQLLQTLNILFENIRNETSLYYLLSNNHINSIIIHKFDFSDEEVMAYYISFLKTLSFKLNSHTIHFFYNEHTNDFPLYTEAIKFFNHPESMVRIAVRTLTLNVYKVEDRSMIQFIRNRTAAPYFSNLVWFIGKHILELDTCVRTDVDHSNRNKLSDLVAEHLDHLHYLNDIFRLNISELNQVLAHHLLNRLLVPLLVYSLNHQSPQDDKPKVSRVVALFLLAQVFLIFSYWPLMQVLCRIIFHEDNAIFTENSATLKHPGFVAPPKSLESSLQDHISESLYDEHENQIIDKDGAGAADSTGATPKTYGSVYTDQSMQTASSPLDGISILEATHVNITDEEKEQLKFHDLYIPASPEMNSRNSNMSSRPFLKCIHDALDCEDNDYAALFSLCLLYAIGHNSGINKKLLAISLGLRVTENRFTSYNYQFIDSLLKVVLESAQHNSKIRVATLEMVLSVLHNLLNLCDTCAPSPRSEQDTFMKDQNLAAIESAKEEATLQLRNFYKGEEIFLDMFEDEWRELMRRPLNVEFLLQDASVLLPPTGTPLTGIDFSKRLPCGEVEKARRYMRVYFLIRGMCLSLKEESDTHLPLTNPAACVQVSDVLDLNNSDLIACVVITRDAQRTRRFLVIDVIQMILVEPDQRRLGWGVAKFVGFLQDLEVVGDKDDSRVLHITIHRPSAVSSSSGKPAPPLLAGKFIFDDHIRCMAAKQRLTKGRTKARQRKLHQIARLLDMPSHLQPCPSPPTHALSTMRLEAQRRSSIRSGVEARHFNQRQRILFQQGTRGPGIALKREGTPNGPRPRSEDIPLEDLSSSNISKANSTGAVNTSTLLKSTNLDPSCSHENKLVDLAQKAMSVFPVAGQVPYRTVELSASETGENYLVTALDPITMALNESSINKVQNIPRLETKFSSANWSEMTDRTIQDSEIDNCEGASSIEPTAFEVKNSNASSANGAKDDSSEFSPLRKLRVKGKIETI